MRKRSPSPSSSDIQLAEIHSAVDVGEEGKRESGKQKKGSFFACYLLCSLSPRFKGHTYIGFTVNPCRRIRQHNGEITSGAWRTKKKRPWEMVLCIYGFPSNVVALQFEWAWQHPKESLAVRDAAAKLKSLSGIGGKIKLAYTMLSLPTWQSYNLTVNFFSTKYTKHIVGCPTLPDHVNTRVLPMDELPCYVEGWVSDNDDDYDANGNLENFDNDNNVSGPDEPIGVCDGGKQPDAEVDHLHLNSWTPDRSITKFFRSRKPVRNRFLSSKEETIPLDASPSKFTSDEDESCIIVSAPKLSGGDLTPSSTMTRVYNENEASPLTIIDLTDSPTCIQL